MLFLYLVKKYIKNTNARFATVRKQSKNQGGWLRSVYELFKRAGKVGPWACSRLGGVVTIDSEMKAKYWFRARIEPLSTRIMAAQKMDKWK